MTLRQKWPKKKPRWDCFVSRLSRAPAQRSAPPGSGSRRGGPAHGPPPFPSPGRDSRCPQAASRAEPSRTHLPPDPGAAPRPRILRLQPRPPPASPAPGAGWGHEKRHKARMEMPYGRSPVSAKNKLEAAGGLTVLEGCEKAYRRRCARLPAEISLPWIKGMLEHHGAARQQHSKMLRAQGARLSTSQTPSAAKVSNKTIKGSC